MREYRIVSPDGGVRWLTGCGWLQHEAAGRPEVLDGLVIDIRNFKKLEDPLLASHRHKENFLAVLAQMLRDPMAPLRNAARLLGSGPGGDAQTAWCSGVIIRQVQRIAVLLDDLFNLSAIKYGRMRLELGPVSVQRAVDAAVEAALPLMQARNQRLEIALPQPPLLLQADAGCIEPVLTNLLTNAARYTPAGGQIRLVGRRIAPAAAGSQAEEVEIAVHDTGIGLALAKGLVELQGGRLRLHSDGFGRGSVFTMVLPALPGGSLAAQAPDAPSTQAASHRVLIADDNPDAAESLSLLLQMAGHVTRTAADGLAALAACAGFDPEVALLDISMPGLNGYEVAQRLRADPARADMLLVALTGWGSPDNREQARLAGFDLCFSKPVDPDELIQLLASTDLLRARAPTPDQASASG